MAIDQVIDYKVRPPKGAEKFFYRMMMIVFTIAIISAFLMLPLLVGLSEQISRDFPYSLLDRISMKQAVGAMIIGTLLVILSILTLELFRSRRSKPRSGNGYLMPVATLLGALVFMLSFVVVALKGMIWSLDWVSSNNWIDLVSQRMSPFILWYFVSLGVIYGASFYAWFILVRIRERREGINRLTGNFFRKSWQYFLGDAFAVKDCPSREDSCMERSLYRFGLFLRTMAICICPTLLLVVVDIAVRQLAV